MEEGPLSYLRLDIQVCPGQSTVGREADSVVACLEDFQNRDESRQYNTRDLNEDSYLIAGALANYQLDVALARSCKSCCDNRQVAVGTEPVGTFWISLLVRNGEE